MRQQRASHEAATSITQDGNTSITQSRDDMIAWRWHVEKNAAEDHMVKLTGPPYMHGDPSVFTR
jgi:hypothetical protein